MLTGHSGMPARVSALCHVPLPGLHRCAACCCCLRLGESGGLPVTGPLADALELPDALLSLAAREGCMSSGAGQAGGGTLAGPVLAPLLLLLGILSPAMKAPCRKAVSSRAVATCIAQQSSLHFTLQQGVPMQIPKLGGPEV